MSNHSINETKDIGSSIEIQLDGCSQIFEIRLIKSFNKFNYNKNAFFWVILLILIICSIYILKLNKKNLINIHYMVLSLTYYLNNLTSGKDSVL